MIWLTGSLDLERTIIFSKEKDFQGRNTGFYCSYTTGFIIWTYRLVYKRGVKILAPECQGTGHLDELVSYYYYLVASMYTITS